METKDKKNSPVVDEYVNVESEAVVNEGNPGAGKVEGEKEESKFPEKAVETAKVIGKATSGAAKTVGKVVGGVAKSVGFFTNIASFFVSNLQTIAKTAGTVVGGVAKSAGLFTNLASFFVANLHTILITMAITVAAGLVGYIVKDMLEGPKIEDTANIVQEVKKISEFTTACFYEESVIQGSKTTTKKHWYGEKIDTIKHEIVLTAKCKVRAGFDLSMLGENDLVVKGDTVSIKLPVPKILDVISNPSDYKIFEETGDWGHEEIVAMQSERKEKVLENALEHNILEKANQIGKGRIVTLFQGLGFNVINVTLSDIPAREQAPAEPIVAAPAENAPAAEPVPAVEVVSAVEEQMPIDTLSQVL